MHVVPPVPPLLVGYGRWFATRLDNANDFIYVGEGMTSSVAVSQLSNGVLNYHNAGKVQASSEPQDMRLQRMLGHLTTLLPPHPTIGARHRLRRRRDGGRGEHRSGAQERDDRRDRAAGAEGRVEVFRRAQLQRRRRTPRCTSQIDDARHFILTTKQKFDAVTSDPLDPWVKGAATLYTKEFFDVVKEHLNSGRRRDAVRAALREQHRSGEERGRDVLPGVPERRRVRQHEQRRRLRSRARRPDGHDEDRRRRDRERSSQSPEYAQVAQSLREIGFNSATELFATFAGNEPMLRPWLADAQINRDRNLRLQFLAGARVESATTRRRSTARCCSTGAIRKVCSSASPERLAQIRMATAERSRTAVRPDRRVIGTEIRDRTDGLPSRRRRHPRRPISSRHGRRNFAAPTSRCSPPASPRSRCSTACSRCMPVFARDFHVSARAEQPLALADDRLSRAGDDRRRRVLRGARPKADDGRVAPRVVAAHDRVRVRTAVGRASRRCARSPASRSPACRRSRWRISSEEVHPTSIGLAMGLAIGGNGLGGMIGRLLTALVTDLLSWRWALAAIGILGLVATVVFWRTLPPSRHFVAASAAHRRAARRTFWRAARAIARLVAALLRWAFCSWARS